MPCPLECTESCQKCYEKVIAGVMEYACYGQCVVVDQMGISHNGPGEAAPAGWTLSPEVTEEMAAYTAMYNNQQTEPTSQLDCCNGGPCPTGNCWSDDLNPCKCQQNQPPNSPGKPVWKRYVRPAMLDRLTQTTVEEQKAALTVARLKFNSKQTPPTDPPTIAHHCGNCTSSFCNDVNGVEHKCWTKTDASGRTCKCWSINEKGLTGAGWIPDNTIHRGDTNFGVDRLIQTTVEEQKAALATARRSANFDKSERIIINTNTSCKGSGTCYACNSAGCDCGSRNTCYERYRPNEDGLYPNVWYHECVCSLNKPIGGAGTGWRRKTQEIKPTTIPKDTPWPEDTEPVNNV